MLWIGFSFFSQLEFKSNFSELNKKASFQNKYLCSSRGKCADETH